MSRTMLVEVPPRKPSESDETRFELEKARLDMKMSLVNQLTLQKIAVHRQTRALAPSGGFESDRADLSKSRAREPPSNTMRAPPRRTYGPRKSEQELYEDARTCIQILEAAMGRPTNPNITAKDLDSMLADYVDEEEDSVELVRSVRDGT